MDLAWDYYFEIWNSGAGRKVSLKSRTGPAAVWGCTRPPAAILRLLAEPQTICRFLCVYVNDTDAQQVFIYVILLNMTQSVLCMMMDNVRCVCQLLQRLLASLGHVVVSQFQLLSVFTVPCLKDLMAHNCSAVLSVGWKYIFVNV